MTPPFRVDTLTFQEEHPESRWQRRLTDELYFPPAKV